MEFLGLRDMSALTRELLVTDPPTQNPSGFWLVCSGGVSEYIYTPCDSGPGDLGPLLGKAVRAKLGELLPENNLLVPTEGIRATVIGACQFTLQVSGETVFASKNTVLPLNNLPVLSVPIDWDRVVAAEVSEAIVRVLANTEEEIPCALFLGGPRQFGYGKLTELARGIAAGFAANQRRAQTVLIFSNDIAHTVGRSLQTFFPKTPFLCLDEVQVADLDYVDVAPPPAGERYYPVVVKSLIFKSQQRR
jgi:ethanolamine utilization protein EutA